MFLFCVNFDLVTDQIYRTVQLMQHKAMKEMFLINFVNLALLFTLLYIVLNLDFGSFYLSDMML